MIGAVLHISNSLPSQRWRGGLIETDVLKCKFKLIRCFEQPRSRAWNSGISGSCMLLRGNWVCLSHAPSNQ
jgi:hypothetical protein